MSPAGGALTVFLLVQWVTVTLQDMSPPDRNMTFPPLPQDFKETAKTLMIKCSNNGYPPPNMTNVLLNSSRVGNPIFLLPALLSALPPPSTNHATLKPNMGEPLQQDQDMNITEKMWNCTNLPQMIEFMRNTTEKVHCFMRAFVAPLSWAAVLQNSSQLSPEHLRTLLWAAKPFLESMPSASLALPSKLQRAHLEEIMKLFSEVFNTLSQEQRDDISRWMKEKVIETEPVCLSNQNIPSMAPTPPKPAVSAKPEPPTGIPSLHTDQMNGVASGDNASNRARRGLAAGDGIRQGAGKVVQLPVPSKPGDVPENQLNHNKPVEIPVNQTKNPGVNNNTLPQTAGNNAKLNKVEKLTEQGNTTVKGKETYVGNGNGTNQSTGEMVTEDLNTVKGQTGYNEEKNSGNNVQKQESEGSVDNGNKTNSFPAGCPRMPWLKTEALRMMGPFLSRLPEADMRAIQTEELCKFFQTPEFPSSFTKPDRLQKATGQMLLQRLKLECFNSSQSFLTHFDRLGSLICFYNDAPSLNATLSKKLLSQLENCDNTGTDQMKRDLVRKVMSEGGVILNQELLRSLGPGVSVLPPSKLSDFSEEVLRDGLPSLSQAPWKPAQAKILAQKLLEKVKDITGENLLSLGSMVRGVDSEMLKKVQLKGMLGNETLKNMTEKLSSLQKKAVLEGMRSSLNESHLVKEVPDSLLASLSLFTLEKAGLNSVDQLDGHGWTRTQSVYLVKKILGQGIRPEQIRKLGQAVQGITCNMINSVNQSDTLEMGQILSRSSNLLSHTQVCCIAQKLFLSLEKQRLNYFVNISDSELQAIPALLLIHLPIKAIQGLPATVCPRFLEKMSQANLSSLPNSALSRSELRDRALRCLGKNASNLSTAEVLSLGPLVCELDPVWLSSLNAAVLNSTLQTWTSCGHIPRPYRAPLFTLITRVYGDPSVWTEDTMKLMGPLLLLNDSALEMLPFKAWLKTSLSDLLDSMQRQYAASAPDEFRSWPDLSALYRKLFQLKTRPIQQRRRREVSPAVQPLLSVIEDLGEGNMYWSPAQLANMTAQTFREALHVLGEMRNYTAEQLVALRQKAIEAWGDLSLLNQSQIVELGCVSQGFNTTELQNLNITSLDTLELLSVCPWNYTQKVAIWKGFAQRTGIKMPKLGAFEMVGLGQFVCGLQPDQIDQLSTGEFKEAVEDVGCAKCPVTVLECLKRRSTSAFGDPKSWGEAEVSMMGNIIAGLNGTELASLNSSVLPFIRQSAIALILPERLAALSVSQLKSLGPDNAAMVTEVQRSGLGVEQRAAVDEALGVPISRSTNSTTSTTTTSPPVAVPLKGGASKQSLLGTAVLPVVLLLLGISL